MVGLQPIRLHGPDVDLFVQSAREAAELLMVTARMAADSPSPSRVTAITDLGWPPVDLFGLAMDVVEEADSSSAIVCVGFPPGYEEMPYGGTTDPHTAGDHSPLLNALEAATAAPTQGPVGSAALPGRDDAVDWSLLSLESSLSSRCATVVRDHLRATCFDYLQVKLGDAPSPVVASMAERGSARPLLTPDHRIAHEVITAHLERQLPSEAELTPPSALIPIG